MDECTGPTVTEWLREQKYEVFSVYDEARGIDDDAILQKAFAENWILKTNDKNFGEKIYRKGYPHRGVILLRLNDERAAAKIETLRRLLRSYADRLPNQFVVVTETKVRFAHR